jgi:CBS-domain-containing membrane protein
VEQIFTLTEEQTRALEELRKEYAEETAKITREAEETLKKFAEQAKELRRKYELKANDVLGGDIKTVKEQLDAIVKDYREKAQAERKGLAERLAALRAEVDKARDGGPEAMRALMEKNADLMGLVRQQMEKDNELAILAKDKMKTAVPEEARAKLDEAFKRREDQRAWMGRPRGERGGERRDAPDAQPPAAQHGDF